MTGAILSGLLCLLTLSAAAQDSTTSTTAQKSTKHKATKKKSGKSSNSSTSTKRTSTGKRSRGKSHGKKRGQQAIDSDRAREIQEALIRKHYLDGEPSGRWDAATEAALRKFQGDQGWQTKTVPDSRALIRLGLGPSKDGLLNPESAMTMPSANGEPKPSSGSAGSDSKPQP